MTLELTNIASQTTSLALNVYLQRERSLWRTLSAIFLTQRLCKVSTWLCLETCRFISSDDIRSRRLRFSVVGREEWCYWLN